MSNAANKSRRTSPSTTGPTTAARIAKYAASAVTKPTARQVSVDQRLSPTSRRCMGMQQLARRQHARAACRSGVFVELALAHAQQRGLGAREEDCADQADDEDQKIGEGSMAAAQDEGRDRIPQRAEGSSRRRCGQPTSKLTPRAQIPCTARRFPHAYPYAYAFRTRMAEVARTRTSTIVVK